MFFSTQWLISEYFWMVAPLDLTLFRTSNSNNNNSNNSNNNNNDNNN